MSFIEDDFYSTKASKGKWKGITQGRGSFGSRGRLAVIIAASVVSGVLLACLFMPFFLSKGSSAADNGKARTAMATEAKINFNDLVIQAAEKVNPAVVGVINRQKLTEEEKALLEQEPGLDQQGDGKGQGQGGNGQGKDEDEDREQNQDGIQLVSVGSGVIFQKDNKTAYIVTNNHVVEDADKVEVILITGERKLAKVVGGDATTDLAVLEVDVTGITAVAEFGNSDLLRAGETAIAIGNPLGLVFSQTITMGIISSPHRLVHVSLEGNMDWEMDFIQTDAAINQGNSGGALANLDGQVIGINSMKVLSMGVEGLGFAIPINEAKPVIESLIQYGKVKRAFIGISHEDLQSFSKGTEVLNLPKGVTKGIIVMGTEGPALKAGLKGKDVIVEMDGMAIDSSLTMRKYLYDHKKIGDEVEIVFYRDGKKKSVTLQLAEKK